MFNDTILREVRDILLEKFKCQGIIYFSDHGEDADINFGHGNELLLNNYKKNNYVKNIVKIPMWITFSDDYILEHPEKFMRTESNHSLYYTNDMIYDTMLGLMGIEGNVYNAKFDITSEQYDLKLEDLKTLHVRLPLKECL